MKTFRHKNYDFDKGYMPIEFEYAEPIVMAEEAPSDDYEEYYDEQYMLNFLVEKYKINAELGKAYFLDLSARMSLMITNEVITLDQGEEYGQLVDKVGVELTKGYFHSAYKAMAEVDPSAVMVEPSAELNTLHTEIKAYLREYVNTKYPEVFHITD